MRPTIRMDDDLLEAAKAAAAGAGQTLTRYIEDSVRRQLAIQQDMEHSVPGSLPVFHGDGLRPGVDLDDNATLLELMGST